ncbi:lipopolysaccharide heptosyltransferase I [Cupriavidus agavae]|uniref:Lipopolysaccharide heptosyltransferase 1 n=1 Tax=Cupriavidus agavae TaxID=1001822 RepID=A0A4Q7S7D9_9BURK|nr:lipopolysaccharide heptosyltransferase I [Cupriavidus agavae]RZT42275.1 heptosyltransferase-1 [Cupriavidus agavae]
MHRSRSLVSKPAQDVLIVRTSSMGDLIHTLPAISDLQVHRPELRISWMAEEGFAEIPRLHAGISDVLPMAWRRWRKSLASRATWRELGQFRRRLQTTPWSLVLDCQGLLKSAVFASLARAPVIGYDRRSAREAAACLFYSEVHPVSRELSAVERNRRLFAETFGYQVEGAPVFGLRAGLLPAWLRTGRYAVLLHATSRASKEWPEANWVALGNRLHAVQGLAAVLPWGNEAEKARAVRLARAIPEAIVAPRIGLHDAARLIGNASAVVGVDTGLTHMANALDVPLVAVYTDTDAARTGVVETPRAVNLGGAGQCPTPDGVWQALCGVQPPAGV